MNLELGKFSDDPDKNMEVLREIGDIWPYLEGHYATFE
jgi:hypothetical protein